MFKVIDGQTGEELAIKEINPGEIAEGQMKARGLNLEEVRAKERRFNATSRVVPTQSVFEGSQEYFLMPAYGKSLKEHLQTDIGQRNYGNGLSLEELLQNMQIS
ncbi:MAG: hypothetical protein AABW80_00750 [Nanoarchaeota archaeon]